METVDYSAKEIDPGLRWEGRRERVRFYIYGKDKTKVTQLPRCVILIIVQEGICLRAVSTDKGEAV